MFGVNLWRWSREQVADIFVLHHPDSEGPDHCQMQIQLTRARGKRCVCWRVSRQKLIRHPMPLISICIDIAYRNPRTYPICAAIVSTLLEFVDSRRNEVVERIRARFAKLPNTGYMEVWLQRISDPNQHNPSFNEALCRLVQGKEVVLWNNDWISSGALKRAVEPSMILNRYKAKNRKPVIKPKEVELSSQSTIDGAVARRATRR